MTRLQKIDLKTKRVLTFAAVFGSEFNFNMLFEVIKKFNHEITDEDLLVSLNNAIKSQLIYETISATGSIVYTFIFDKIIDTLLAKLSENDLKRIHEEVGNVIEKFYSENDKFYKLAYHFLCANKRSKAYNYSYKAGEDALKSYSYKLAIKFFTQALDILRKYSKDTLEAHENRIKLSLTIVDIQHQTGDYRENIELLDEILPVAEKIKDKEDIARIYFLKGRNLSFMGDQVHAMECYYKALPIAEELNIKDILAIVYCSMGRSKAYSAEYDEAIELLTKGLSFFSEKDRFNIERLYPLGMLAQSYGHTGQKYNSKDSLEELKKFLEIEDPKIRLWTNFYIGCAISLLGEYLEGFEYLNKTLEESRKVKNPAIEATCLLFNGKNYAYANDYREAIKSVSKSIEIGLAHNFSISFYLFYFYLAEYYIILGNYTDAKECISDGSKENYRIGIKKEYFGQWQKRLLAFLELISPLPDIENALKLIDEAIHLTENMSNTYKFHKAHNYFVKSLILKRTNNEDNEKYFEMAKNIYEELGLKNDIERIKKIRDMFSLQKVLDEEIEEDKTESYLESTSTHTGSTTDFYYQRQLKYLLKLSEKLAQIHEMEYLLNTIIQLSIEVSGAENGFLLLFENSGGIGKIENLKVRVKKSVNITNEEDLDYHKETVKSCALDRKGKLILDAEKEFKDDEEIKKYSLKSIIAVPMLISGAIVGVIYLDNRQVKGLFTRENFELLKAFAIEAAISIENARLYQKIKETAKLEEEMRIAEDIQTSILPENLEVPGFKIGAYMRTATEVGGDYYDFYLENQPYFGVFGDVAGHGLKSGLVMMMSEVSFNTIMRNEDLKKLDLKYLYNIINRTLYENIQNRIVKRSKKGIEYSNIYMTFRIFKFDDKGNFEMYGNDHAEPFILKSENDEIITIPSRGMLLGLLLDDEQDETYKFKLDSNDILVLYSDGITEGKRYNNELGRNEFFGEEKLFETIKNNKNKDVNDIIKAVIDDVDEWIDEQHDDITIVVIKKL